MKKIKAVLVVKDQEPRIVEINDSFKIYLDIINKNLSDKEKDICIGQGVDSFSIGIQNICGWVEEYSACHPYERNRDWHGPALFIQFNDCGDTCDVTDDKFKEICHLYSLSKKAKSPSKKINDFVEAYGPDPEIFNVIYESNFGTLNILDYVDFILNRDDPEEVKFLEEVILEYIKEIASDNNITIKEAFRRYLKELGEKIFKQQANQLL